jgi:hypothetical protein
MLLRLLLGLVLLVIVAGGGVYFAAQQKTSVGRDLKQVTSSTQAAQTFDDKMRSVQASVDAAKKTGKSAAVEVTFTEEELTSKAAQATTTLTGGVAATDTQIHLSGGNIVATSKVTVQGVDLNVGIVATPVVENGQTKIVVQTIETGALPIPDALKQQIQASVGQAVDPKSLGLPFDVSKLQIIDGKIVISGTTKP